MLCAIPYESGKSFGHSFTDILTNNAETSLFNLGEDWLWHDFGGITCQVELNKVILFLRVISVCVFGVVVELLLHVLL